MENKIDVYYKNKHVGTLARANNVYAFQYDDDWIVNGFSISPFSLPLKKGLFIPNNLYFDGFFGVFADSLPDAWGRLLLKRYLRKKGIDNYDGLYMLACIGKNGMGALEYKPSIVNDYKDIIDFDLYQKQADLILKDDLNVNIDLLYHYGGSSGGARPKALINYNNEEWIVKFQSRYDINNIGLCEYKYLLCAKEIGINIPDVKLFTSSINSGYFGIKRFDRLEKEKVHIISAAALLEADFQTTVCDYLDLFKLTKIITKDNIDDLKQLYMRMCFNVYAHNYDDHLKNFSFFYDELSKTYRLTPAYDLTYSTTSFNEHTTTVNNKGINITLDDLVYCGIKSGLKQKYCVDMALFILDKVKENLSDYLN